MQIGRYEVLEELGRGGMGAVYRGRDPGSGREVAIKVLLKGREATPRQRTRFDREARALAKVDHRHVVRLLDAGEHKGAPYLVMAYHSEGSLQDILKTALLSPEMAVRLGVQLAAGLEAAHAVGVLHRDLKPDNVLFGANGVAMLTDFGLAKDLEREGQTQALTKSGTLQGTPGYWAPEQAAGKLSAVGPATDVYGLGAVLYAALTGRAPIEGEGLMAILTATAHARPTPLRSLRPEAPRELESVVMRCLEKEPGARWANAAELKEALATCLEARPASPTSNRPLLLTAAGVVLLGALAVAGLWRGTLAAPSPTPLPSASPSSDATRAPSVPAVSRVSPRPSLARATTSPRAGTSPRVRESTDAIVERGQLAQQAGRLPEAGALFRRAAERGNTDAMFLLGGLLQSGSGVTKDEAQAVSWFRRAANEGHPGAMYNLGVMLANGWGVAREEAQGVELFRRAALKGHPDALYNMGVAREHGIAMAKDEALAVKWYRQAADKGNPNGSFNLGVMLASGRGAPKNEALAARRYREAADKGHVSASYNLGTMLLLGGRGVPKDEPQAAKWYRRAAEEGHFGAMFKLGALLETGRGVPKDEAQAAAFYRRAAKSDDLGIRRVAQAALERLAR